MGFFKSISLRTRAEKIASNFAIFRKEQFDFTVRNIANRKIPYYQQILGGDADFALKGYQLWVFAIFPRTSDYMPAPNFREFAGYVSLALYGNEQKAVEGYFHQFHEYRKDEADQLIRVAIPIADYIVGESDPVAWTITARLLPIFTINTQMVIADEFNDRRTLQSLELQMKNVREALTKLPD